MKLKLSCNEIKNNVAVLLIYIDNGIVQILWDREVSRSVMALKCVLVPNVQFSVRRVELNAQLPYLPATVFAGI